MLVRDGSNLTKHISTVGEGTELNPYIVKNNVSIQDQTSNTIMLPLVEQVGIGTLTVGAVLNEYTVTVDNTSNAEVGTHFRIINSTNDRYYWGAILAINGLVLTLDTPIDFAYTSGSEITYSNSNMNVDGSITPVHFHLRTGSPSIPSSIDITRMILVCECNSPVDLNKFGDIDGGVTRGIVFRKKNSHQNNMFNIKSNADMVGLGYDWTPFEESKVNQGIDGFAWRLTFAGQNKMGVALRVGQDGQLGLIVQDDLTSLVRLSCMVEGHVVDEY